MKNLRTFEDFSSEASVNATRKPLYALYEDEGGGKLLSICRTEREADREYERLKRDFAELQWDEDSKEEYGDNYELYELEFDPEIEIREIFPDNADDVYDAFESVVMYNDTHLAMDLIEEYGMDPMMYFKDVKDVIDFFKGYIDWWTDPPEKIKRMRRGKSAFGM
jgi:hypothetical protein